MTDKKVTINDVNLITELVDVIDAALRKFEEISLIHALRLDPLYNQLVLLVREIIRNTGFDINLTNDMHQVDASWLTREIREAISLDELNALQNECAELIEFYSDPDNYDTETYISNKLLNVINHIKLLFKQGNKRLASGEEDDYISNYLSVFIFDLDRKVCSEIKTGGQKDSGCTLYPALGVNLFKDKSDKFHKVASILIAGAIFIPRLQEVYEASSLALDSREFRFIEKVICSFTSVIDPAFCEASNLFHQAGIENNKTIAVVRNQDAPEDVLEIYLSKPILPGGQIMGTGTAIKSVSGAGAAVMMGMGTGIISQIDALGISKGKITSDTGTDHHTHSDVQPGNSADTETGSAPFSNHRPEVNSRIIVDTTDRPQRTELFRFPEIATPPAGEKNEYVLLNTIAKREFKGKDFIITRGVTSDVSGEVPEYIRQTQVILRPHI